MPLPVETWRTIGPEAVLRVTNDDDNIYLRCISMLEWRLTTRSSAKTEDGIRAQRGPFEAQVAEAE